MTTTEAAFARAHFGETRKHPAPLYGTLIARTERVGYVCDIISGDEGQGHVGSYVDALKDEFDVIVCANVISERMAGILSRRGFQPEVHYAPVPFEQHVQAWVWRAPLNAEPVRLEDTEADGERVTCGP